MRMSENCPGCEASAESGSVCYFYRIGLRIGIPVDLALGRVENLEEKYFFITEKNNFENNHIWRFSLPLPIYDPYCFLLKDFWEI